MPGGKNSKLRAHHRNTRPRTIIGGTLLRRALGRTVESHGRFVEPDRETAALLLQILEADLESETTRAEVEPVLQRLRAVVGRTAPQEPAAQSV